VRLGNIVVKRRVWVGSIFALTAIGVWWAWTNSTKPQLAAAAKPAQPFVRLASLGGSASDQVLRERAEFFDPTPLFFPTRWNFGQGLLQENMRREPDQVFASFEPNLTFAEQYFKAHVSAATGAPERLADVLGQGNERPLGGIGQIDRPSSSLGTRTGFLEVSSLMDGKTVINQSFADIVLPPLDYHPLEFIAIVSSSGLVGEPAMVTGSGSEEVDSLLRTYLVKTFRLGERLNPGRYRVLVGP